MLAWGKNFMPLTDLFLDYFPGYNKFRAVSMILVIAEFTLPLLGFIALNKFLISDKTEHEKKKPLQMAFYTAGGLSLFFAFMPSLFFDFVGVQDDNLRQNGWPVEALQSDRAGLLSADAWRSFIFITFGSCVSSIFNFSASLINLLCTRSFVSIILFSNDIILSIVIL